MSKPNDMIEKLKSIPQEIKDLNQRKFGLALKKADVEKQLSIMEADAKHEINQAIDVDTGKPKFKNEPDRKAELDRIRAMDADFIEKFEKLEDINMKIFEISNEVEYLHSTQSNFRVILNYESK